MNAEKTTSLPFNTAILFLVFNRPNTTQEVFEAIRQAKPPKLYVAADGARQKNIDEANVVAEVRRIATEVDWPCEVKTLFRHENQGCKHAVSSAIDWFFANEEQGIILEDDCLPCPSFFDFCQKMLEEHKEDKKVGMISGFNPMGAEVVSENYFKSNNPSIWGWATWRDRWRQYDLHMIEWNNLEVREKIKSRLDFKIRMYYTLAYNLVSKNMLNTWDYQWAFCLMKNQLLTIKPIANFIKNIGTDGAHAKGVDKNHNTHYGKSPSINFKLQHGVENLQDYLFSKHSLPSTFHLIAKNVIYRAGLYSPARTLFFRLKKVLS